MSTIHSRPKDPLDLTHWVAGPEAKMEISREEMKTTASWDEWSSESGPRNKSYPGGPELSPALRLLLHEDPTRVHRVLVPATMRQMLG